MRAEIIHTDISIIGGGSVGLPGTREAVWIGAQSDPLALISRDCQVIGTEGLLCENSFLFPKNDKWRFKCTIYFDSRKGNRKYFGLDQTAIC